MGIVINRFPVLVLALALGGCASGPAIREVFFAAGENCNPSQRDALLESAEILKLLEDYFAAIGDQDREQLAACFSEQFSYYDRDRQWLVDQVEQDYFRPYDSIAAGASRIEIELVKKEAASWIRQEGFDWLNGPGGGSAFARDYLITVASAGGEFTVSFRSGSSSRAGRGREPPPAVVRVDIRVRSDPDITVPLGQVSFILNLDAKKASGGELKLTEKVIFLLEKEGGEWKIVSRQ